jgi:hypothetical protein
MPVRFAAPARMLRPRLSPEEARAACWLPANDNSSGTASDAMVHAALRHFAEHGLAAAHHAHKQAELALGEKNLREFEWWLGICRALDRQMARELDARVKVAVE